MKNMSDKSKKRLVISGLSLVCVSLIIAIAVRFRTEKPADILPAGSIASDDVKPDQPMPTEVNKTVIEPSLPAPTEEEKIVIKPNIQTPTLAPSAAGNTAVSTGTEQTIQPDVTKPPGPSEEQLTDPSQKPDGEIVTEPPKDEDHDEVVTPSSPPAKAGEPQGGDKKDGKIFVPGFGWIQDNGGGGIGEVVGSDGDINKQVGEMGGKE